MTKTLFFALLVQILLAGLMAEFGLAFMATAFLTTGLITAVALTAPGG